MSLAGDAAQRLTPYVELVASFVEGGLAAEEFQQRYADRYLNDSTEWTDDEFSVLDALFGDTEMFEADPVLRPEVIDAIDEEELRAAARRALDALRRLGD